MDIQMQSATSFDLLQQLAEVDKIGFEIIFITGDGAKEHLIKAIKFSAIDYLYKPLDDTELVVAVNKTIEKLNLKQQNEQVKVLLDRLLPIEPKSSKIAFHLRGGVIELINVSEIKYLKADGVISYVNIKDGRNLATSKNLGFYKEILINDYSFVMISNSYLVNREYIKKFNSRDLSVMLADNTVLFASKRFGRELKDSLGSNTRKQLRDIFSGLLFFKNSD
jgi:two-component system LytT family response regulator